MAAKKQVTVQLDPDVWKEIAAEARTMGLTGNQLIAVWSTQQAKRSRSVKIEIGGDDAPRPAA